MNVKVMKSAMTATRQSAVHKKPQIDWIFYSLHI